MTAKDAGLAGFSMATNAHRRTRGLWSAAVLVAACYGVFLVVTALRSPSGAELTGQFWLQPAVKASAAVLLTAAALTHPIARERRWLIGALAGSAVGDFLLACRGGSRRSCSGWLPFSSRICASWPLCSRCAQRRRRG